MKHTLTMRAMSAGIVALVALAACDHDITAPRTQSPPDTTAVVAAAIVHTELDAELISSEIGRLSAAFDAAAAATDLSSALARWDRGAETNDAGASRDFVGRMLKTLAVDQNPELAADADALRLLLDATRLTGVPTAKRSFAAPR